MGLSNFNLPAGCTQRDISPTSTCECCGRDIDENNSDEIDNDMCSRCIARADEEQDEAIDYGNTLRNL